VVMNCMVGDSVQKHVYREYRQKHPVLSKLPLPTNRELCIILKKAASGLKHLHQFGLIHRDIACRNILLGALSGNRVENKTEVRISDFGLTRQMEQGTTDKAFQSTVTNFGPLKWMSPESIRDKKYGRATDIYMFGITMWEIFYGMEPYPQMGALKVAHGVVKERLRPVVPGKGATYTDMPDAYETLMGRCWAQKANERPRFEHVLVELQKIEDFGFKRVP